MLPAVAVVATLLSGSWWNPLDWDSFVDGIVESMGDGLVKLLNLAFNNPLTIVSGDEWQAAFGQAAKWGGVFAVVAVAMCAVEIIAGTIASDHGRIVRGWLWAILAWPLTAASLLVFSRLVNASDWLTASILDSVTAGAPVAGAAAVTGATSAATTALVSMLLGVSAFSTWWLVLIFVGLVMLPVLLLVLVLGAVTFGQLALAGFAPIALMLVGFRGTRPMSGRWLQMAVALLLTKPIAAGIIALGCAVAQGGGMDGLIMGIIAVTVAVGSPALAFSFVGFAGAQLGGAMTAHADKVRGLTNSLTHAGANQGLGAVRERLGKKAREAADTARQGAGSIGAGSEASGGAAAAGGAQGTGGTSAGNPTRAAFAGAASIRDGEGGVRGAQGSRRRRSPERDGVDASARSKAGANGHSDRNGHGGPAGADVADGARVAGPSGTAVGPVDGGTSTSDVSGGSMDVDRDGLSRADGESPSIAGGSSEGVGAPEGLAAGGVGEVAPGLSGTSSASSTRPIRHGGGSPSPVSRAGEARETGESGPSPSSAATGSGAGPTAASATSATTSSGPGAAPGASSSRATPTQPTAPPTADPAAGSSGPNPFGGGR